MRKNKKNKTSVNLQLFNSIINSVDDAVYSTDLEGRVFSWNKGAERIFKYKKSEILGTVFVDKIVPEDKKEEVLHIKSLVKAGKRVAPYETARITKNKKRIYVSVTLSYIKNKYKKNIGLLVIARDITERRTIEKERNNLLKELNQLISVAPVGIGFLDENLRFMRVNKKLTEMDGISIEGHLQKSLWEVFPRDFATKIVENIESHYQKDTYGFEINGIINKKSRQGAYWSIMCYPVEFSQGKTGIGMILQDITEQKLLEKRKDDFLSMASHELKTPVATIKAFTQILMYQKIDRIKKRRDYLNRISNQVEKLTKTVNDLLDISRIRSGKLSILKEKFSFDSLVEDIVANYNDVKGISQKINIVGHTDKSVFADRDMLQHVVNNLLNNAIRYSPGAKAIELFLDSDSYYIYFSVKDYGVGISHENQKRIFESFYRVIENDAIDYPGLGIGLYISQEIVKMHQGIISLKSELGKGSTFYVKLPIGNIAL